MSGKSRGQAFEDFLVLTVCALSGGRMEEQYLAIAGRYTAGEPGKRGIDLLASTFGKLVSLIEETRADILGDLFMGAITFGENGQFYTPEGVTDLLAQMAGTGATVFDPCCGSGRMLLSAATLNARRTFVGQDIDMRCVRMTAINLALRNLYGYVIWGNSLTAEQRLVYQTGFDGVGFIREVPPSGDAPAGSPPLPPGSPREQPNLFDQSE